MRRPIWELKLREAATRQEFYPFLNLGLQKLLFGAYKTAPTTYGKLVTFTDSDKSKEGYPSLGSTALPKRVLEGEPFPEGNFPAKDYVEVTNQKFGEIISVTSEMVEDDKTNEIVRQPTDLGNAHAKYEDKGFYSLVTTNATGYDSQATFSLNHPGFTGGAAIAANDNIYTNVTMSANALAVSLGRIAGWTGHTVDDLLGIIARYIVAPENLRHTSLMLAQSEFLPLAFAAGTLGPGASIGVAKNTMKDVNLGVVISPRLDVASTTDWYVFTDFPGFIHQWRKKLSWFQESDKSGTFFERGVYRWRTEARFRQYIINWRFGMLVS